ncbi:ABC transporter permease subunit [Flavobacteriaceae bacterium F08102]|nr:ABC transporter permease subunit [Flavobacteriaceae bacterium F08102]
MFYYNFKYELKILLRSRWIQLISGLLLVLFVFASFNGSQKIEKRKAEISKAREAVKTSDARMLQQLDSIEKGHKVQVARWMVPTSPIAIGNYYPRVAAMDPNEMGFIAVGQSDVFTHYVSPRVSADDFSINFTEMTSPIQLLFGSFDLVFVLVYLLPLIIIAFSYNVLSEEKERGSLRLLASQPISIKKWVFQKLGLRFFWMAVIITVISLGVFLLNDVVSISGLLSFLALIFCYMLFWFSLAFAINLLVGESAKNALSLIGLWIVFVLLMPSLISQTGDIFFKIPPRMQMVQEIREHKAEAVKKQDEILDNFLRDHPEYAVNDSAQSRNFWHGYMASQNLLKEELQPLLSSYDEKLEEQQNWINKLKWTSPAIITQRALGRLAGTTKQDYDTYQEQVLQFAEEWRSFFMPLLFNNGVFTSELAKSLPAFEYKPKSDNYLVSSLLGLLVMTCVIMGVTVSMYSIRSKETGILGS